MGEMHQINQAMHKKICHIGKNVNSLTDWFYNSYGLDPEIFEVVKSTNPKFQ